MTSRPKPLTRDQIEAHYMHSQHQEDECEVCHAIYQIALRSLDQRTFNEGIEAAAKMCDEAVTDIERNPTADERIAFGYRVGADVAMNMADAIRKLKEPK